MMIPGFEQRQVEATVARAIRLEIEDFHYEYCHVLDSGRLMEWEDFIDCGDWVVAPWSARLHGHGSGIAIDVSETYAVLVRDGLRARLSRPVYYELASLAAKNPAGAGEGVWSGGAFFVLDHDS